MQNFLLKLGIHLIITAGAIVAISMVVPMTGDQRMIVLLVFAAVDVLTDYLVFAPVKSAANVLELFEEIDNDEANLDPDPVADGNPDRWVRN